MVISIISYIFIILKKIFTELYKYITILTLINEVFVVV